MSEICEKSQICRTCLGTSEKMTCVFNTLVFDRTESQICDVIISYASVQICEGDGLPELVCHRCIRKLQHVFVFRKTCEESYATLKERFNAIQDASDFEAEASIIDLSQNKEQENVDDEVEYTGEFIFIPEENNPLKTIADSNSKAHGKGKTGPKEKFKKLSSSHKAEDALCVNGNDQDPQKEPHESPFINKQLEHTNDEHNESADDCHSNNESFQTNALPIDQDCIDKSVNLVAKNYSTYRTCDICKDTVTSTMFARHLLLHSMKRRFPCKLCTKRYSSNDHLKTHQQRTHADTEDYRLCNVCGKRFKYSSLKAHIAVHADEKLLKCNFCGRGFNNHSNLAVHKRTHTGEKPYKCDVCGRCFAQSSVCKHHMKGHTGEKPYECKLCGEKYVNRKSLTYHVRSKHTQERPYKCNECGHGFVNNRMLKEHGLVHSGERPYMCSTCGKSFKRHTHLTNHMKVHIPKH